MIIDDEASVRSPTPQANELPVSVETPHVQSPEFMQIDTPEHV
jgi:hypothetical protein